MPEAAVAAAEGLQPRRDHIQCQWEEKCLAAAHVDNTLIRMGGYFYCPMQTEDTKKVMDKTKAVYLL